MGLLDFLFRLFRPRRDRSSDRNRQPRPKKPRRRPRLTPLRNAHSERTWERNNTVESKEPPYAFAHIGVGTGGYRDLSLDSDDVRLAENGLPVFRTPEELARWLGLPLGRVAWLVHRFSDDPRPKTEALAHYHFHWLPKRSGGRRLIESPKRMLKAAQTQILREILDQIPAHECAHGFARNRSIVTNATPHVGGAVVVKYDLLNFYPSVTFGRVTAIFRSLGYCREAGIWLARLTTSALPANMPFIKQEPSAVLPYLRRHLPQGAPTSPALANLSAYSLDVRLSGLARSFGAIYTRYADDITFSGPPSFSGSLRDFIPLVGQIIRQERFRVNVAKRKVLRSGSALVITGVVVNSKVNIKRRHFDRLKAVLTNCVRHGPSTQNRKAHPKFAAHLRGRVAHVMQLNPERGAKLLALYEQIDWKR